MASFGKMVWPDHGANGLRIVSTEADIIQGIQASGRYDAQVGSETDGRRLLQQAMPDAIELLPALPWEALSETTGRVQEMVSTPSNRD